MDLLMREWTDIMIGYAVAAILITASGLGLAAPAYKCMVDGQLSYQQSPCPSGQQRKQQSLEELNAEEWRRRAASAATPAKAPAPHTGTPGPTILPKETSTYRCDGRRHCSQMSSCAEAKFFLANCPGVEMDGDRDGIPCEQQHCH
ncbi:excalibur calcium-binding domain-containing protein [Roseateles sp.]|jgi:hypothetical protein|uniref:excalibur calcium-binding domain-containing protein n=1 Tax=Roseateles sp. TaxID=1971397 RepID=UPI00391A0782